MPRPVISPLLILTAMTSALVVGCQPGREPAPRLPVVQSQRLETAEFQASFDTVSTLEAEEEVDLAAQAGGRIQRLLVRQGDRVRQGQLLLVLDQAQLRAE
ncbi:MAG: hypothetical protein RLZZ274_577, partial [Cyanobacteriota bacterium]